MGSAVKRAIHPAPRFESLPPQAECIRSRTQRGAIMCIFCCGVLKKQQQPQLQRRLDLLFPGLSFLLPPQNSRLYPTLPYLRATQTQTDRSARECRDSISLGRLEQRTLTTSGGCASVLCDKQLPLAPLLAGAPPPPPFPPMSHLHYTNQLHACYSTLPPHRHSLS